MEANSVFLGSRVAFLQLSQGDKYGLIAWLLPSGQPAAYQGHSERDLPGSWLNLPVLMGSLVQNDGLRKVGLALLI